MSAPFPASMVPGELCRGIADELINSYNTRSNKVRVIKTPGGKLRYQHLKKRGSPPKCGDCGTKLPGVSHPTLAPPSRWAICFYLERLYQTYFRNDTQKKVLKPGSITDPSPPPSRICQNFQTQEDRPESLWRIEVFRLCERSGCAGVSD